MKIIKPSAELIFERDPYKLVERIGRTCYKSENKITEDSCYSFVASLAKRHHFAMLEHARYSFEINSASDTSLNCFIRLANIPGVVIRRVDQNKYIVGLSLSHIYNPYWRIESLWGADIKSFLNSISSMLMNEAFSTNDSESNLEICYIPNIELYLRNRNMLNLCPSLVYRTAHFICDRGVSHEIVRHRCSFGQESTRYCNYTLSDRFGNDICFIEPYGYSDWSSTQKEDFESVMLSCEYYYNSMIASGMTPQQARAVLPNALKTELYMTCSLLQWEHFLNIRAIGTTGSPHPDMKVVASKIMNEMKQLDINMFTPEFQTKLAKL